jgi:hypothetical protein
VEVSHAIAAIGSRNISKAEQFIKDNCPDGGAAQKDGSSKIKMEAKGSYKDCVEDPVSFERVVGIKADLVECSSCLYWDT